MDLTLQRLLHYSPKTNVQTIGLDGLLEDVVSLMTDLPNDTLIYAIGNQVGAGQDILEKISKYHHHG